MAAAAAAVTVTAANSQAAAAAARATPARRGPSHRLRTARPRLRAPRGVLLRGRRAAARRDGDDAGGGAGARPEAEEELDYAVFRFTLGIPGFDDADLPRVVGALVAAALTANHLLSQAPLPAPQARAELLGYALAAA